MAGSRRTQWDLTETVWARELAGLRKTGVQLWDLTVANPTRCGFSYPAGDLLGPLGQPSALLYEPDPKGQPAARQAISDYYRDHAVEVNPEHVLLTSSTSEAYSFLFRLLCDAGDEVLIGQPGYPLFDFLAQLDDVRLKPYQLFYDHGWHLDAGALEQQITSRTRALVVVHPNNPTGHFTSVADRQALESVCDKYGLALIVDEVFLDFGLAGVAGKSFATGPHPVPTFVLSGLSKVAGLPQMKAAWIACFAEEDLRLRLEVIADTFLSVSTPVQCALPVWLRGRNSIQQQIKARVAANLSSLDEMLTSSSALSRLRVDGGWYAIVQVPQLRTDEDLALELLRERQVVIHTGSFFGFGERGRVVISLLGPEGEFLSGVRELQQYFLQL